MQVVMFEGQYVVSVLNIRYTPEVRATPHHPSEGGDLEFEVEGISVIDENAFSIELTSEQIDDWMSHYGEDLSTEVYSKYTSMY